MKYDTVVIGSGISGLTASVICALNNKKTALFEKSPKIAPLLSRFKRNGIYCDPGFHYAGGLQKNGQLSLIFKYMGINIDSCPLDPVCFDKIITDKNEYNMPYGFDRLSDYLCSMFPESRSAVTVFLNRIKTILDDNPFTNFNSKNQDYQNLYNISLKEYLKNLGAEDELINLLGTHAYFFSGVESEEIPLSLYTHIMCPLYSHACALPEGGDSLVNAFRKRIESLDIDVYTKTEITEIVSNSNREITAVKTKDDKYIECYNCISTIHPQILINILPKGYVRPVFIKRIRKYKNTVSPFVVFLNFSVTPQSVSNSNCLINSKSFSNTKCGLLTPGSSCKSGTCFSFVNYLDNETTQSFFNDNYYNAKKTETLKITEYLKNIFPHSNISIIDTATPKTYNRFTGTVNGSMFGIKQSVNQHLTGIKGGLKRLYLAGQSLTPGIMGSVYSSLTAVMQIIDPENIWSGIRKYL